MVDETQFEKFVADKRGFFASIKTIDDAKARAYDKHHRYDFVATNEKFIVEEFELLIKRLRKEETNQEIFWLYCYYCCIMLQNYHLAYGQKEKADSYLKLRIEIKKRCVYGVYPLKKANNDSFITYLCKRIVAGLVEMVRIPFESSKIRDQISFANISRIYWVFCRLMLTKAFLVAWELDWFEKLENLLGTPIDVDEILSNLEIPTEFFKGLSVGFFAARFIINAGTLIKHVFYPSAEEKHLDITTRFINELYKRHADLLNDFVWGPANLLTNYNHLFHIAAPVAGWLVVVFLVFDFGLIFWRRYLAEKEYLAKRLQLTNDLGYYQAKLQDKPNLSILNKMELIKLIEERMVFEEHCRLLSGQIKDLDIKWQAKDSTFWFNASAAFLLIIGFSASMIVSSPVLAMACYAIGVIAVSIYLSADSYNNYKEKEFYLDDALLENKNLPQALSEYRTARTDFYLTIAKNVILPSLIITTFALCWQAALVLAAVYLCYQLAKAYSTYLDSKPPVVDPSEEELGIELLSLN